MTTSFQHVTANGVSIHVATAGPENGKPILLLHGFPEFWYGWRNQIPALADAGFRVIAPDQRGYNLSAKPAGIAAYDLNMLTQDMVSLLDALKIDKAAVAGHDWGGGTAWWLASHFAQRVEKLIILNSPHGGVFNRFVRRDLTQLRKSWYFFYFQLPGLPEASMAAGGWRAGFDSMVRSARPGTFSEENFLKYREAWSQPGAMTAMINWYRAVVQRPPRNIPRHKVKPPTLIIWGKRDNFLNWQMAQLSADRCADAQLIMLDDASHWLQHEEPEKINRLMIDFAK